jgi:ring-1,2-phenylacetyl-CoA epoxidase subunit PaaA
MKESFESLIASGKKIEAYDEIPNDYRQMALRMFKFHAFSEVFGSLPEGEWISKAPNLFRKKILTAKVQDEVGHGQILLRVCEDLGPTREELLKELADGKGKYLNIFHYELETWADVALIGWLIDGAEIDRQLTLQESSFGPYARAMKKIVYEEAFHYRQGLDAIQTMMRGSKKQQDMVNDAVSRWWERTLMLFGPHDSDSPHNDAAMNYRLKIKSNDELRNEWLKQYVPRIKKMGVSIPDKKLHFDERKQKWIYTEPDWDELKKVKEGNLPANQRRLKKFRETYYKNQWARELVYTVG